MRTLALIKKECLHFWRDPLLMIVVLWATTMDVYLCAQGFSLSIQSFPVATYDLDRTQASEQLLSELRPPRFRVVRRITDSSDIDRLLLTGQALMVVAVEEGC